MPEKKKKIGMNRCIWLLLWLFLIFGAAIWLFFVNNIIGGLTLLVAGIGILLVFIARSGEDEELDARSNYELLRLYTRSAFFLFIILGVSLIIAVIVELLINPLMN